MNASLAAAYPAKASDIAAEDERSKGADFRSHFRDIPANEFVALCFFDADGFGIVVPPGTQRQFSSKVHNRLMEAVRVDGTPYVLTAGRTDNIGIRPVPAAGG